jgi:hypothetical protein
MTTQTHMALSAVQICLVLVTTLGRDYYKISLPYTGAFLPLNGQEEAEDLF